VLDLEFNRQLIFRQCSKSVIDFEIGNGDGEETTLLSMREKFLEKLQINAERGPELPSHEI
jgi:hypothetical protein